MSGLTGEEISAADLARFNRAWQVYREAIEQDGEVFQIATSGYYNACDTHGTVDEGCLAFGLCMLSSMEGLLTPRGEASQETRDWFEARGVTA